MEITWNVGLENAAKGIVKRVKDKKEVKDEESVYEKYLRERGEKKKAARAAKRAAAKGKGDAEEVEEAPSAVKGSVFNDPFFTSVDTKPRRKKKGADAKQSEKVNTEHDGVCCKELFVAP